MNEKTSSFKIAICPTCYETLIQYKTQITFRDLNKFTTSCHTCMHTVTTSVTFIGEYDMTCEQCFNVQHDVLRRQLQLAYLQYKQRACSKCTIY